jgi:multimeric flavodoxin WrbA
MRVLAINASPHMDKGNTAMILNPFLEGMKEAGSEVDLFYTSKLRVEPCHGDLSCWLVLPGECAVKDDMQMRPWEWRKQRSLSEHSCDPMPIS